MNSAVMVWIVIIGAIIGGFYLYKQGKMPWLKGKSIRLPKLFEPKLDVLIVKLREQADRERLKTAELVKVLEAKKELSRVRAENAQLRKQIASIGEKLIEKARPDAERGAQETQKVKQRRL